jgi:LacI family transcriptional regulator
MRDVASAAGTSVATVSHVLNDTRYVSGELRARVEDALGSLGYLPDGTARSLRLGRTRTIGLLVPDNSNPYFAALARLIEDEAFRAGYTTILGNSNEQRQRELEYVRTVLSKRVDALVIAATSQADGALQALLRPFGGPVLFIDRDIEIGGRDCVVFDNEGGGRLVAEHLLALGHRELACIAGPREVAPTAARLAGFVDALAAAGVAMDPARVARGDFRFASGAAAARRLLDERPGFTGLFVVNHLMAAGAVDALVAAGQRVPADISVVGYDDALPALMGRTPLTTVRQPIETMVACAVGRLLRHLQIDDPAPSERHVLPVELVVRCSTGPAPTSGSEGAMS